MPIAIRQASISDSEDVARLVTSLGYPTSNSEMRKRMEMILRDEHYATLVACDDRSVVGFIGTRVGPLYESDGLYGQIMALAVKLDHQQQGVGRLLMKTAEAMLMERGAHVLVVGSGNHRPEAHSFYEKNGYEFTGRRYMKSVSTISRATKG